MFIIHFISVCPIKGYFFSLGTNFFPALMQEKEAEHLPTRDHKGISVSGSVYSITFLMVSCSQYYREIFLCFFFFSFFCKAELFEQVEQSI